jgi:hypothetical protein
MGGQAGTGGRSWQDVYGVANPGDLRSLGSLGRTSGWEALAAGLSVVISQSTKAIRLAAAAAGQTRTLLESNKPLTVQVGAQTIVEPAIEGALILTNAIRGRGV